MKPSILIVDDEPGMVSSCVTVLQSRTDSFIPELEIDTATSAQAGLDLLRERTYDLLISDLRMVGMDGMELLGRARGLDPDLIVVMITAYPTVETASEAIQDGAADYLVKPFTAEQLRLVVGRSLFQRRLRDENRWLRQQLTRPPAIGGLIGASEAIQEISLLIKRVAKSTANVMVLGETGTGKSLIAGAIHAAGPRRSQPFVQVDCGSLPEYLLESELFGHEKGAFTGAHEGRRGLLQCADGGTFFLDEICELSLPLQSTILGALQDRRFRRVGGREPIGVDVRVIVATNQDIEARVTAGEFREDLYYRLNVIAIRLPPLRERLGDVPLLATHFIETFNRKNEASIRGVTPRALACLNAYAWPGNVRELQNVIERACSLTAGEILDLVDLPEHLSGESPTQGESHPLSFAEERKEHLRRFERVYLETVLRETGGNVKDAAARARLPRTTMYRYLEKHDLTPQRFR